MGRPLLADQSEQAWCLTVLTNLAKLDPAGWRPLRPAAPDLSLLL